jgi:hypothetical protein
MSFPQTVRYSTLVRLVFPVVLVSLLVIIFTVVMLDLVFTMFQGRNNELLVSAGRHQYETSSAYCRQLNEEQIEALVEEKLVLQANVNECLADKNRELLETTKYLRDEIEKLSNKKNKEIETTEGTMECRHHQQPSTNHSDVTDVEGHQKPTAEETNAIHLNL